ncbi:MAG: hypothetical protein V1921_02835 [Candidatus Altiarchaeota archaeon]
MLVRAAIIVLVLLTAGCVRECPPSCFDDNPCTAEYCSKDTGYKCAYNNLSGPQYGCNTTVDNLRYLCETGKCVVSQPEERT